VFKAYSKRAGFAVTTIVLYCVANAIFFINEGIYWDDWTLYNASFEVLYKTFKDASGTPLYGYIHYYLQQTPNPPLTYNLITGIIQCFVIWLNYKILDLLDLKGEFWLWIPLLAAIIPFFSAKNTMICLPYTIHYGFFIFAFYLMLKSKVSSNIILRGISLAFFFISFIVNSLLFFYIIPYAIYYLKCSKVSLPVFLSQLRAPFNLFKAKSFCRSADYLLLPILYYIFKSVFLKTDGLYNALGYNSISIKGLVKGFAKCIQAFIGSFILLFEEITKGVFHDRYLTIFLFFFCICFLLIIRLKPADFRRLVSKEENYIATIFIGLIIFAIGAYPYCVVGKVPTFEGYDTRHQLLLPVGSSIILVSLVYIFFKKKLTFIILSFLTILFLFTTMSQNLQYFKGGLKQNSIVQHFKNNKLIHDNTSFLFLDLCEEYDANSREYAFYSLNGMSKMAFGVEDKLICEYNEFVKYGNNYGWDVLSQDSKKFNMKDYSFQVPTHLIKIDNGSYPLTTISVIKLIVLKYLNPLKYDNSINDIIIMDVMEIDFKTAENFLNDE